MFVPSSAMAGVPLPGRGTPPPGARASGEAAAVPAGGEAPASGASAFALLEEGAPAVSGEKPLAREAAGEELEPEAEPGATSGSEFADGAEAIVSGMAWQATPVASTPAGSIGISVPGSATTPGAVMPVASVPVSPESVPSAPRAEAPVAGAAPGHALTLGGAMTRVAGSLPGVDMALPKDGAAEPPSDPVAATGGVARPATANVEASAGSGPPVGSPAPLGLASAGQVPAVGTMAGEAVQTSGSEARPPAGGAGG